MAKLHFVTQEKLENSDIYIEIVADGVFHGFSKPFQSP